MNYEVNYNTCVYNLIKIKLNFSIVHVYNIEYTSTYTVIE